MSLIISLLFSIFSSIALAQPTPMLKCLALEEQHFHQLKTQGPIYRLNQKVILMISQFPKIQSHPQLLKKICTMNFSDSPSMYLFEELLVNSSNVFSIPSDLPEEQRALLQNTMEEMKEGFPEMLITFLAELQSTLETPNCLNRVVKEADYFTDRFKYLQGVVNNEQLFEDKKKIRSLFSQLRNWNDIVEKCRLPIQKKKD